MKTTIIEYENVISPFVLTDITIQVPFNISIQCFSLEIQGPPGEIYPLQWRHNELNGVSDYQPRDCLLNRLFRCRSKKTLKLRVTGLCKGIHRWLVNFPHKGPVTRKMFPFDDVIMPSTICQWVAITWKNDEVPDYCPSNDHQVTYPVLVFSRYPT